MHNEPRPDVHVLVVHRFEVPGLRELLELHRLERRIVGKVDDFIAEFRAEFDADFDAAKARVDADLADMRAKINDLQARADAGDTTAIAALNVLRQEVHSRINTLDPTKPETLPPVETPAPTETAPA